MAVPSTQGGQTDGNDNDKIPNVSKIVLCTVQSSTSGHFKDLPGKSVLMAFHLHLRFYRRYGERKRYIENKYRAR